jgi:hypothetical protein
MIFWKDLRGKNRTFLHQIPLPDVGLEGPWVIDNCGSSMNARLHFAHPLLMAFQLFRVLKFHPGVFLGKFPIPVLSVNSFT